MGTLLALVGAISWVLGFIAIVIIVQAVISWLIAFNVINLHNDFVRAVWTTLDRLTAPLYRPIRRIMPDFGGIDLSPLVVLILIQVLRMLLSGVQADIATSMMYS